MTTRNTQATEWREIFKQPSLNGGEIYVTPRLIPTLQMQLGLIEEEYRELKEVVEEWISCSKTRISDESARVVKVNLIKELSDLSFVCEQLAAFLRVDLDEAMDRVFESNMTKLDDDGNAIFNEAGKVMKGPNYIQPHLDDLI